MLFNRAHNEQFLPTNCIATNVVVMLICPKLARWRLYAYSKMNTRCHICQNTVDVISSWFKKIFVNINTLRPTQNDRCFADEVLEYNLLKGHVWISPKISLKFVPKGQMNNIPALVHVMPWHQSGDRPLYEPVMVNYWRIYVLFGLIESIFATK